MDTVSKMEIVNSLFDILSSPDEEASEIIDPYRFSPYPSNHLGSFSRLSSEYRENWIDFKKLHSILGGRHTMSDMRTVYDEVLNRIAQMDYSEEWGKLSKYITGSNLPTLEQNSILGTKVSDHVKKKRGEKYVILDIGVGGLETTSSILSNLKPHEVQNMEFLLSDVSTDSIDSSEKRLVSDYGVDKSKIHRIETGVPLSKSIVNLYRGGVDSVVSGAGLHCVPEIFRALSNVHDILSDNGLLYFWDWTHHLWKSPKIKAGYNIPDDRRSVNGVVEAAASWVDLFGYGDNFKDKLKRDIKSQIRESGFDFVCWVRKNLESVEPDYKKSKSMPYRAIRSNVGSEAIESHLKSIFGNCVTTKYSGTFVLNGFNSSKLN